VDLPVPADGRVAGASTGLGRRGTPIATGPGGVRTVGLTPHGGHDPASSVDDRGQIVGLPCLPDAHRLLAFLHEDGVTHDLNTLFDLVSTGWRLEKATAISTQGFVAGNGSSYGQARGCLLR
jgi:hypothetical protein